jgi:excisionase family DNA binding protein
MLKDVDTNRECIPTPEASRRSGLSKSHLTRLLKSGALEGFQLGRDWLIYADSLEKYMATPHKPGPKGPIHKKASQAGQQDKVQESPEQ